MENVLVDREMKVRVCDFGSAALGGVGVPARESVGRLEWEFESVSTPFYRAPEVVDMRMGLPVGEKIDVYALGVLLYLLMFRKPPFESALAKVSKFYTFP
jgi:serine/threonine protein kinase